MRKVALAVAGMAMAAGSVSASAQWYPGGGYPRGGYPGGWYPGGGWSDGRGWRHHRDRDDSGAILAGLAVLGVVLAVASAGNGSGRGGDARAAENGCRFAIEQRLGAGYRARITEARRSGSGWQVRGVVDTPTPGTPMPPFVCQMRGGQVERIDVDGYRGGDW